MLEAGNGNGRLNCKRFVDGGDVMLGLWLGAIDLEARNRTAASSEMIS